MDASGIPATSFNQSLDGQRRESITEAVQSQYMNMNQAPKKVAGVPDGEFSLFTWIWDRVHNGVIASYPFLDYICREKRDA